MKDIITVIYLKNNFAQEIATVIEPQGAYVALSGNKVASVQFDNSSVETSTLV